MQSIPSKTKTHFLIIIQFLYLQKKKKNTQKEPNKQKTNKEKEWDTFEQYDLLPQRYSKYKYFLYNLKIQSCIRRDVIYCTWNSSHDQVWFFALGLLCRLSKWSQNCSLSMAVSDTVKASNNAS